MNLDSERDIGFALNEFSMRTEEEALLEKLGLKPGMTFEFHQVDVSEADMQYVLATFEEEKLLRKDTTYEIFTPLNADDAALTLLKYKRELQESRNPVFEVWSPDVDEASANKILERTKRREA
jgi:hypothetical protein